MVWGNSQRHCVSRCAYGTTYSVGVLVMSGAFIVWPCAERRKANAIMTCESQSLRNLQMDFDMSENIGEERVDRIVESSP